MTEEKELKVEIIGIPADVPIADINAELTDLGYTIHSITPLFSLGKKVARNAFLVKLRKAGQYETIYNLNSLFHLRVRVQAFESRPGPKPVSYTHLDVYKRQVQD